MAGILSKGITLEYKEKSTSTTTWNKVANVQEIPDLGGTAESVEVTTLANAAHMFINGIDSYSDSLDFTCLYVKGDVSGTGEDAGKGFTTISGLGHETPKKAYEWKVTLPAAAGEASGSTCTFDAEPSVKIDGVGVNAPLTYTLSLKPTSVMVFA